MEIIKVNRLDDSGLKVFAGLTEHQLRQAGCGEGLFIAESPKVIRVALDSGYEPVSLLCEEKHIEGDAHDIILRCPEMIVYSGNRDILMELTGYNLTRGVLCAMKRRPLPSAAEICRNARRIAVIESVCDTTNIGSIFRSTAAMGLDGIILTPDSCDPLNRRSIRVSMGTVFRIPWTFDNDPVGRLKELGFTTVALTLQKDSILINDPVLKSQHRLAMVLGTEGDGLSEGIIAKCDYKAIIPMHHEVDSLNVGAAAAVAFWELR